MHVLLTGGSGDLGTLLSEDLLARKHRVTNVDMVPPRIGGPSYVEGSILDLQTCRAAMAGVDCVVHIAAWHGIHEGQKTPRAFHDLNVTGSFNILQAAVDAGVQKFVFISSTSIADRYSLYGHTKVLGEEMVTAYASRHGLEAVILRPRAFIPSWNRTVYNDFMAWANWFCKGAVHIKDVTAATSIAIDLLRAGQLPRENGVPVFPIDGAYDYSAETLDNWDQDGAGSSFQKQYPGFIALAEQHGLDIARKPKVLEISPAQQLPGYRPTYALQNLLEDLQTYGLAGPPPPFDKGAQPPIATSNV